MKKSIVRAAVATGVAAAAVVGTALPASAIISSWRANCVGDYKTLSYWKIDNPNKADLQQYGTARLRQCTAYESGEGYFTAFYTEAYLNSGAGLRVQISFYMLNGNVYTDSQTGSGTDWNPSPAMGMDPNDAVHRIVPGVSGHRLYQ